MKHYIALLAACLVLAACASTPPAREESGATTAPAAETTTPPATDATLGVPASGAVSAGTMTESAREAEQKGLQDKSIYFDFDSFVVKAEYRDLLNEHMSILNEHPQDSVTLIGNADERGSPEYNLALGSKRAYAVHKQLVLLGIPASRIHEVSYGEEKPRATCHDESCWKQNRRVDFAYRSNSQ